MATQTCIIRVRSGLLFGSILTMTIVGVLGQDATAPVWAKPDHFWFRKAMDGGHVWLTVDALHGVKEPLFDHQRLAIELGVRGAGEFEPLKLPFVDPGAQFAVRYNGSNAYIQEGALAIEFNLNDQFWRCDLQIKWNWNLVPPTDYECLPRRPATLGPGTACRAGAHRVTRQELGGDRSEPQRRRSGGAAAAIVRMLTTDGTADNGYQLGSIQWANDSRSLSAYRVHADVWRAPGLTGNVKKLIAKGTWPCSELWGAQDSARSSHRGASV